MRWGSLILGALAIIVGVVWTLQGLNILGGSVMRWMATFAQADGWQVHLA